MITFQTPQDRQYVRLFITGPQSLLPYSKLARAYLDEKWLDLLKRMGFDQFIEGQEVCVVSTAGKGRGRVRRCNVIATATDTIPWFIKKLKTPIDTYYPVRLELRSPTRKKVGRPAKKRAPAPSPVTPAAGGTQAVSTAVEPPVTVDVKPLIIKEEPKDESGDPEHNNVMSFQEAANRVLNVMPGCSAAANTLRKPTVAEVAKPRRKRKASEVDGYCKCRV